MKLIKMAFVFLTAFILMSCAEDLSTKNLNPSNYNVVFGIIKKGTLELEKETSIIPLIYQETGFLVGYVVQSKDQSKFSEYSIAYPPSLGVAGKKVKKIEDGSTGLKGPVARSLNGNVVQTYGFAKGDPIGKWKLDFYINDQFLKTIEFDVVDEKDF